MASQDTSAIVVAIDLVPMPIRPPDSRGGPHRLSQDGSHGATPGSFAPEAVATTATNTHRLGQGLRELASRTTLWKAFLYRSITSTFAGLSRNPLCQLLCSVQELCQQKQGLLGKVLLVATFLATVLMMWPSMQSAVDSRRSFALARWTALKDFFELCEAHNWELPACEATAKVAPGPPPDVKARDIKHQDPLSSDVSANSGVLALVGIGCLLFSVALAATKREAECLRCREMWLKPTSRPMVTVEGFPITHRKRKQPMSPQQGGVRAQEQANGRSTTVDRSVTVLLPASTDDRLRKRLVMESMEKTDNKFKLACPYFIKNPNRFATSCTCSGPGWDHVPRLRGHLYRQHGLQEFSCHRCHERFSDAVHLVEHYQMDSPCTTAPAHIRDTEAGFDRDQRQEMDSLLRMKLSNVDYWKRIYGILFQIPENSSEIPSPC